MSRYAARVDDNQAEVVAALRKAGATVQSLAEVGRGCADLLVGYQNKTALIEVKDGAKPPSARQLTPAQLKWHAEWRGGTLCVVDNIEAALRVLKVMAA
jgi:hypothetical protein